MEHTKVIKDQRGKIEITAKLVTFSFGQKDKSGNKFRYDIVVMHTKPKHRTSYVNMNIATIKEIEDAALELWQLIKP
jgi:hypothetical protein